MPWLSRAFRRSALSSRDADDQHVTFSACHDFGLQWNSELRIEDNAQQRAAARQAGAVGEQAIIFEHRSDAGQNCIGEMADLLNVTPGHFAGDPADIILRSRYFAVKRQSCLDSDQRLPVRMKWMKASFRSSGSVGGFLVEGYVDPGVSEAFETLSPYLWIWIFHGRADAAYAGSNYGMGAGRVRP